MVDLDPKLVAGFTDLVNGNLQIAGDLECLGTGETTIFQSLLDRLVEQFFFFGRFHDEIFTLDAKTNSGFIADRPGDCKIFLEHKNETKKPAKISFTIPFRLTKQNEKIVSVNKSDLFPGFYYHNGISGEEVKGMKRWAGLSVFLVAALFVGGCAVYTPKDIHAVEELIQQAQTVGAQKKAAYEYYSAVEHLNVAREELSEADDEHAKVFGDKARAMAEKALQKSK